MPEKGEVVAGQAEFHPSSNGRSLEISTSEKAIINYKRFNISEEEHVQFIQPSSKSSVLNRITGDDPSKILGNLSGNGRVFLVNPNGIYFGPNSTVNIGSFVASTLNIRDEDFLNDKFHFFKDSNSKKASIINEGRIAANPEGFIAFLAPIIENRGSILARAGKVVLAAAERVTLDFSGDGLIQFTVDGDLEKALIENYGQIEAAGGSVAISMRTARDAIKMVVNTDGMTPANDIQEMDGAIYLVSKSQIVANEVHIDGKEGSKVNVQGNIDASNFQCGEKGGTVHILGEEVHLLGAKVDASGDCGGGSVLIGGDYQGKGDTPTARNTFMDLDSEIYADAIKYGDGGKVILWADDTTLFDGKIFARGGERGGNGGFVETSGKNDLGIGCGYVDTSAVNGEFGTWLLDPNNITIGVGGNATIAQCSAPNCGNPPNRMISSATIAASASNVALCAQRNANSSITVSAAVTMNNPGVSLTLTAGSGNTGPINLNNNITTRGALIGLTGVVTMAANAALDTTNAGEFPAGANITLSNTVNGARNLTLNGGTGGTVLMSGAVGGSTPLTSLTATGGTITQSATATATGGITYNATSAINLGGNLTTSGGIIDINGPVNLNTNIIADSTSGGATPAGANIDFSGTINGARSLTLRAGTAGNVSLSGAVGGTTPLTDLSFTSANLIQIGDDINVTGDNPLVFPSPVSITGSSNINSSNANITFNSTINGANALTLTGGTGTINLTSAIGGTTPLASLTATGTTINQSSTAMTSGALSYTGSTAININGNITTSSGPITMTGPVILTATSFDTTNSGASSLGANISFSNTLNGAVALNLNAGSAGNIFFGGAVGGITPLTSLTATGFTITQNASARVIGPVSYTGSTGINVSGNITTSGNTIGLVGPVVIASNPIFDTTNGGGSPAGANISFSNTLNGATTLTLLAGTGGNVIFSGAVGEITPLTNLLFTSANLIQIGNNITVSGANPLIFPFPVQLTGLSNITSNNADITFNDTINSDVAFTRTLRFIAGSGDITLTGAVGGATPVGTLAISSAADVTANNITVGALSQAAGTGATTFNGPIATSNILGINLTGTAFTFNDIVTTTNGGGVSITNSGILSMPSGSNFTLSGSFSQLGMGQTQVGNIITSDNGILFTGPVALTSAANFSTSAASVQISFLSTIDSISTTPFDLTLDAGTSNINISGNVGFINPLGAFLINQTNNLTMSGLTANSATLNGGTGLTTILGDITIGSGGISVTGNDFFNDGNVVTTDGGSIVINNSGTATRGPGNTTVVDGDYSIIGTGPAFAGSSLTVRGNILINPPVTLVANAVVDTSGGGGNITFSNTVNGTRNFTLSAGSGDILFSGNLGFAVPIGNITISSANNVTTQGIQAASITQTTGTGTTTFNGALTTSGALGISINTNAIIRGAAITTTGGGPLTITNSGLFTSTVAGAISLDGPFTQNGTGGVDFGGSITTTNDDISFASAIDLASDSSFNTGTGAGNIVLSQTIDGAFDLNLNSGTGNITLSAGVGSITPLIDFIITRAANVFTQSISSSSINQAAGSGTTTFNGPLNTTGASGISLTGTAFTFNDTFTTAGTGPLSLTNTGLVTFSVGATGSIAGGLTQTGGGSTLLSSSITAGGAMEFNDPFSVSGAGSLSTTNQPITFFSTIDGPGDLTLSPGSGDILIADDAGGVTPLGDLIISTAQNVTTEAITASSITQSAGTGTTLFNGDISTSGAGGISLTGTAFTFIENATASNAGSISINNSGLLTTSAGKTLFGEAGFSQIGTGSVSLGSNISASDANITFNSAITLTSNVTLNSGTTSGDITVDTVDGDFNLTFTAGQDIFAGVIGGTTRLGAVSATTARNITASSITAASITQLAGSGTTSLVGDINTNSPAGINLVGTNFSRSGAIVTTNGGSFVVTNSGSITGTSINTTSIDGSYTQIGVGPADSTDLAGTITARLGISLSSPITLNSDPGNLTPIILDSSGGNGDITVTGTINNDAMAPHTLILRSGAGNTSLNANVGDMVPIGPLILGNINDFTAVDLSVDSIQQEALTTLSGQASFNGPILTTGSSGIDLTGNVFTFNDDVMTTNNGIVAITNSGLLTIASGVSFNLDGSFTQSGAGPVSLGGDITTTSDDISFASDVTLIAPVSLDSGTGIGDITFSGSIDGGVALNINANAGNINFLDMIGQTTPLSGLTIQSAANILFDADAIISGSFTVMSATGSSTFNGVLEANDIDLTGASITFNNAVTTTGGSIAISNSGLLTVATMSPITSSAGFTQIGAGSVSLGSNITSAGLLSIASPITLTQNILLNSGNGNLILSDTVGGMFNLGLTAGTGDITIAGNVGAPRIGDFTITSANNITVEAITATSLSLLSSSGTATLNGSLDSNTIGGITLIGNNFTTSGTITTTNGGPLTVTNSGLITATGASMVTLNGGGAFTQNGTGPVNLGGTVTTQNANISLASSANVLLPTTFTSNGGNILFSNTIDGPDCLTLIAGVGDVTLNGTVGGTTPLGCLDMSGANIFQNSSIQTMGFVQATGTSGIFVGEDITTSNNDITFVGNVTITTSSAALSTGVGAGDISVSGTLNGDIAGRDLTMQSGTGDITLSSTIGGNNPFNDITLSGANITLDNLGSMVIAATGTTSVSATTDLTFTSTTYNSGSQVYTAGGNFNFTAGSPTSMTSNTQPITFNTGTIQLNTTDLTIISNGGNITLTPLLGTGRDLTVDSDVGALNFVQIGAPGNNLNSVFLVSNAFSPTPLLNTNVFTNNLTVESSVPQIISTNQSSGVITYNAPIIFQGNITYSCGGPGTITFNRRVEANTPGVDTLTFNFNPCGGSVIFNAPVGSVSPLASISFDSATNVTANSTINVGAFSSVNGTGTVALNSGITSTAMGGINISNPTINLAGSITTANGGPIILANTGTLTISAGTSFDISGAFQQTGAGAVSVGGSIVTHDSEIQFTGPISLSGSLSLNTVDLIGENISFADVIQGSQNLTLEAGSGSITCNDAIGSVTPLIDILINSADNVTASSSISASTITQLAGIGVTNFDVLSTTGLNGINLTGNAFTFSDNVTTTNSGPLSINNSSALTFTNASYLIAGPLTQSGSGSTTMAGTFTVGGAISLAQTVTLSGTTSLNTSANSQNITFSDLQGPHNLSLSAGGGNITCNGDIGAIPIGVLTISNVNNANFNSISALSLTQSAGTGTTIISDDITTSGASGIDLTGTNFTINSTVTTTGTGPFSIMNSGPLSLTLGSSTLIDGVFSQSGGGGISLSGTLATNNQNLSFANAINLIGPSILSTDTGAGTITLSSTVNGNRALTLTAGTGNVVFGGSLGASTPLGALTINSVNNVTYPLVNAASIVQVASSGTTTITGPFSTTGAMGVSISGGTINQNGAITTANEGPVSFINSGTLTVANGVNTIASGPYSQSGGGGVNLGGSVTSINDPVFFDGTVALTADVNIISGPATSNGNDITFSSAITGAHALNVTSIGGTITFVADVGTLVTPLSSFTVTNADIVSTQGVFADSIVQLVGTGFTSFNGPINATSISGIDLSATAFTFNDTVTSSGPLILTNSGTAIFTSSATGMITGAFTQDGTGSVQLSSAITAGGSVSFTGPFTAVGTGSITTKAANQPISFQNTVDGPGNLTLSSGTEDISFHFDIGNLTRLGSLTITTVRNLLAQNIFASSIEQSAGSNSSQFNGNLNTNGTSGIDLTGTNFLFSGDLTATGGGGITLTNSGTLTTTIGKTFSSDDIFTQNGSGSVLLGSTIQTTNATPANADINFSGTSAITLIAPTSIDSSIGGGTINFSAASTVNGAQSITLNAGTGDINVLGDFGGVTRIGKFTITNANDVQVQAITASSISQLSGSGTSNLLGSLNTNTPFGITLIGNNFTTGPGAMSIITTNGGSLTITNQGVVMESTPIVITLDGSFIQNGPGILFLGPATARQGFSFTGPVILPISTTLDSSGGPGNITFNNVVSALAGTEDLILDAGSGNITFTQPIGLTTTIGSFPVTSLNSITADGETISINDIGDMANIGITGNTTLTASSEVIFTGTTYNANTQTYTANSLFTMDVGSLTTFSSNGNSITFTGAGIELSTGTDLTINTGGSNVMIETINAVAGNQRNLILNAGVGSIQIDGLGTEGNGEFATASYTGTNLTLGDQFADTFSFNYTGTLNAGGNIVSTDTSLVFPNPVVLQGTNVFSTTGDSINDTIGNTGADITFTSTLNGAVADTFGLTLKAGTGDISFSSSVGNTNRLLSLQIDAAEDVTLAALASMSVDALIQLSGSGTTTFDGPIVIPGVIGIMLTGNNFTFNSTVQTLNNASLRVTNSGILTLAGTATLSGAFTQTSSSGPVSLSGTITAGQPISFSGPVSLLGTPSLDTSTANQTIRFLNTLGGNGDITLASGGGDIILQADTGSASASIGDITINSSHDITAQSVFAQSLQLVSSTGLATVNGTLSTNEAAGITLVGKDFILNGALFTTNGGSVVVTNSGLITGFASSSRIVDGSYTQNGTGPVNFAGSLTTNTGTISFTSPITLLGPTVFDSSPGNQNTTFFSTIDGPSSLSIGAGGGDILFSQIVGEDVALSGLTVSSANDITVNGIGSTASGVLGSLNIQVSNDINLPSDTYSANSQIYSAGNSTNFTAGTLTNLTSFGGNVRFTNGTTTLSSGTDLEVITNNGDFSFINVLGANLESILVDTGTGIASLNEISSLGMIDELIVEAGRITFSGPIEANEISFVSLKSIANASSPVLIQSPNTVFFNGLGGDVGTLSSPISVQTTGQIFAGAGGRIDSLANFSGSSSDNTVNEILSNPPCIIIFNDVEIANCGFVPPTPSPIPVGVTVPFTVPGFYSSYFNLASDFYFYFYFFDEKYVERNVVMYWSAPAGSL